MRSASSAPQAWPTRSIGGRWRPGLRAASWRSRPLVAPKRAGDAWEAQRDGVDVELGAERVPDLAGLEHAVDEYSGHQVSASRGHGLAHGVFA
jgi:hypothetical protein